MAIVQNISSEIGDIIRIQTEVPIIGIVSLTSFLDDVTGETGAIYFDKSFRYSIDGGLNFTEWQNLTLINIQSISITRKDQFVIDYRYVHTGVEPTSDLAFNNLTLSGDFQELPYNVYRRNIFNLFFDVNDVIVLGWAINVLEKLYNKGIVADYITRKWDEINPILFDTDFIVLFNSITHYFAIIVYYARQFEDISTNSILLSKFIENLGLFTNTNITDTHLQYLFENYTEEFRKRGTNAISEINNDENTPDGELVRLINYVIPEEFVFALLEPYATGWCISQSSPMYNGTRQCLNMIKGYEKIEGFESLSAYPTYPDVSALNITTTPNTLEILASLATEITGIYSETLDTSTAIKINSVLDYEIVLKLQQNGVTEQLNFGVKFFDSEGVLLSGYNLKDKAVSDFFFSDQRLPRADETYLVTAILFNEDTDNDIDDTQEMGLNIGFGGNLKIPATAKYIMPFVYNYHAVSNPDKTTLIDFKVRPLNFNFSLGKLGLKNILYVLYKNNSIFNSQYIYNNIKNKLIPYKNELIDNNFDSI